MPGLVDSYSHIGEGDGGDRSALITTHVTGIFVDGKVVKN